MQLKSIPEADRDELFEACIALVASQNAVCAALMKFILAKGLKPTREMELLAAEWEIARSRLDDIERKVLRAQAH